jgi:hypothetical protein
MEQVSGKGGTGRVGATGAVDTAAGVRGRGSQIQAMDRGFGPAQTRDGPEDQLLVQCGGAAVEGSADEVGVAVL